jgi:ssDNA-binding replication factor A large subunit
MVLRVVSVHITKERKRYDGTLVRQADVVVGDSNGVVDMVARNDQIDMIKKDQVILVRNCHANVVNEHIRLEVDRWGKIESSSSDKVTDVPEVGNNLSAVAYEVVNGGKK